jgi:hypothetical protein
MSSIFLYAQHMNVHNIYCAFWNKKVFLNDNKPTLTSETSYSHIIIDKNYNYHYVEQKNDSQRVLNRQYFVTA